MCITYELEQDDKDSIPTLWMLLANRLVGRCLLGILSVLLSLPLLLSGAEPVVRPHEGRMVPICVGR